MSWRDRATLVTKSPALPVKGNAYIDDVGTKPMDEAGVLKTIDPGNWRNRAVPVQAEAPQEQPPVPQPAARENPAGDKFQSEHPIMRTVGRAGRNIAAGLGAMGDVALLVPKTAALGVGMATGNESLQKFGMQPGLHDNVQTLIDQGTGNKLAPTGLADKIGDFSSEMIAGAGFSSLPQRAATQAPGIVDAVRGVMNPAEAISNAMPKVTNNLVPQAKKTPPSSKRSFASADDAYKVLDESQTVLTPQGVQKFVAAAEKAADLDPQVLTVFPNSETAKTLQGLRSLSESGEPVKIQTLHKIVKNLNQAINKHFKDGLDENGLELLNIKEAILEAAQANPEDLTGGSAGFEAWQQANKFYSQGSRLEDVERIVQRAKLTKNPATSMQTGARNLLLNAKKTRGYTSEQLTALERMAETGKAGDVLHVFGNRLIPAAASVAGGAMGGWPGAIIGGGLAHAGTAASRAGATGLQESKANALMRALAPQTDQFVTPAISQKQKAMAAALSNITARGQ